MFPPGLYIWRLNDPRSNDMPSAPTNYEGGVEGSTCDFFRAGQPCIVHPLQSKLMKTFLWWFLTGSATTLGVLMVQGGFQELISGDKSSTSFLLTITGGGLLAGCVAIILNRIK